MVSKLLRRQIERVVRPVQASPLRKNRMREELLAHLTRLYEEEGDRCSGDRDMALAAAVARFGEPAVLRRELQGTVPVWERISWRPLPGFPRVERQPGETITGLLARGARWVLALSAMTWLSVFVVVLLFDRPGGHTISLLNLSIAALAGTAAMLAGILGHPLVCEAIRQEWVALPARGSPNRVIALVRLLACTIVAVALMAGLIPAFLALINVVAGFPIFTGRLLWGLSLATAAISLPLTAVQVRGLQQFEDWGSLEIDGEMVS